jgi:hypothetical protein
MHNNKKNHTSLDYRGPYWSDRYDRWMVDIMHPFIIRKPFLSRQKALHYIQKQELIKSRLFEQD